MPGHHRNYPAIVIFIAAQALAVAACPVRAQDAPAAQATPAATPPLAAPPPVGAPAAQPGPAAAPAETTAGPQQVPEMQPASPAQQAAAEAAPPSTVNPVVAAIRTKLASSDIGKSANPDDVAALVSFYGARTEGPLWITEMGFSAKGQDALFEIEKAGDWGLDAKAFVLPAADALPKTPDEQADAEIKLDLAVLKYARFARGGRFTPLSISKLLDQTPPVRDPALVLSEIAVSDAPGTYLSDLNPKHEQFVRLRDAYLKARNGIGDKPADEKTIRRILINMERWRWMPENLGAVYVLVNSPEFMLYVVKDGKTIYADKTLVGTLNYATPVFTSDMATIVFNPDWNAPETVVTENLLPHLRDGNFDILKVHKLSVSYNGSPINPAKVSWSRGNVLNYTFTQKGGPTNVLGKVKFLYPNRHTVYMHDTLPVRKKYFKEKVRMIGHECVRMEKPDKFAEVLLAEGNGWPASKVKNLWDNGLNSSATLERKIPVHMTYFTAIVGDDGKLSTYTDVYGLDLKMAAAMFGDAKGFPPPPPESARPATDDASAAAAAASRPAKRTASGDGIAGSLGGFLDN